MEDEHDRLDNDLLAIANDENIPGYRVYHAMADLVEERAATLIDEERMLEDTALMCFPEVRNAYYGDHEVRDELSV